MTTRTFQPRGITRVSDRDRAIARARQAGCPISEVARTYNLSERFVSVIVLRVRQADEDAAFLRRNPIAS
jgi:DNA-binding NarL/FixJ family response regulator